MCAHLCENCCCLLFYTVMYLYMTVWFMCLTLIWRWRRLWLVHTTSLRHWFLNLYAGYIFRVLYYFILVLWRWSAAYPQLLTCASCIVRRCFAMYIFSCWLTPHAFFGAVVGPVGLIILINIVAFIMVVKQLHTVTSRRGSTYSEASMEKERNISMQVRGAFAVFVLLGLTWAMAGMCWVNVVRLQNNFTCSLLVIELYIKIFTWQKYIDFYCNK